MEGPKWLFLLVVVFQISSVFSTFGHAVGKTKKQRAFGILDSSIILDLSSPEVTLRSGVNNVIPKILSTIKKELSVKNQITLSFSVTTPANKQAAYMTQAQNELLSVLGTYFPDCHINIRSTPQMNYWGYLTHITFDVSLKRGEAVKPMMSGEGVTIIEIQPQMNLIAEIRATLVALLPRVKKGLQSKNEVTFTIDIRIPSNSNSAFLEKIQSSLIEQLTTYFPGYNVQLSYTTRNVKGSTDVVYTVKLIRESSKVTSNTPGNSVLILTLKYGTSITTELSKYLPGLVFDIQSLYTGGKPASFSIKLDTGRGLTDDGIDDAKNQITAMLKKYFPKAEIVLSVIESGSESVTIQVDINPDTGSGSGVSHPLPHYEINLKLPGADFMAELNTLLMRILPRTAEDFKRSFSFNILLIPPQLVDVDYIDQMSKQITDTIRSRFPKCNVVIDANIKENAWGGIVDVMFEILLQPNGIKKPKDRTETKKLEKITIDIGRHRDMLIKQIEKWLKGLTPSIMRIFGNGQTATIIINIKPERKTRRKHLKEISTLLLSIIISEFPNNKIDQRVKKVEDSSGFVKTSEMEIVLHPEKRNALLKEEILPPFTIDLSTPGSSLDTIMVKNIIPKIFETIGEMKSKNMRYQIPFNVRLPKRSDKKEVRDISVQIADYFGKFFPEYFLDFITNGVQKVKNIEDVVIKVYLVPGKSAGNNGLYVGVTPPVSFEHHFPIAVKPLLPKIDKWLQPKLVEIFSQLNKGPVVIEFRLTPPHKSPIEYANSVLDQIKEWMINVFHHCNIAIGITSFRDKHDHLKEITILVTLEPRSSDTDAVDDPSPTQVPTTVQSLPTTIQTLSTTVQTLPTAVPTLQTTISTLPPTMSTPPFVTYPPNTPSWPSTVFVTSTVPPTWLPPENKIPIINMTLPPGSDIEEIIKPGLHNIAIDIMTTLKTAKESSIQYFINFPEGTNKFDLQGMINMIKSIYQSHFPNYVIKVNIGDIYGSGNSITSAVFTIVIETIKYPEVNIDISQSPTSISEILKVKLPEIEDIIRNSMGSGNKAGAQIVIFKPTDESPQFIVEAIKTLIKQIEASFPDIHYELEVDIGDPSKIDIILRWITKEDQNVHENEIKDKNGNVQIVIDIQEVQTSLTESIDAYLNKIYTALKYFVDTGRNIKLVMNIEQKGDANSIVVEEIVEHLKAKLQGMFTNVVVGITPYVKNDYNNNINYIQLNVVLQPNLRNLKEGFEEVKLDMSNPELTLDVIIQNSIPKIASIVEKYLLDERTITLNFNIIPPKNSMDSFLSAITDVMVPTLISYFCNSDSKWKINSNTDVDGYLINVALSITFFPTPNFRSKQCEKQITIDISEPGRQIEAEVDKILPPMYLQINKNLEKGLGQILDFKFAVKVQRNMQGYIQQLAQHVEKIISNYFPYNQVRIQTRGEQTEGRFYVDVIITIEPDLDPLPKPNVTIPLEVSQKESIAIYAVPAVKRYMPQIQALMAKKLPVVIGFQINPPAGANEDYYRNLINEMMNVMQELFPEKSLNMRGRGAKTSQGEYFKIALVFTFL